MINLKPKKVRFFLLSIVCANLFIIVEVQIVNSSSLSNSFFIVDSLTNTSTKSNAQEKNKNNAKTLLEFESSDSGIKIKGEKTEIPFGKKIVLSGTHSSQISEMSIRQIYGNVDEEIDAKVSNKNWYAVTGPFPVNEEIVLIFDIKSHVTEKERAKLIQKFDEAFDDFLEDLFESKFQNNEEIGEALRPLLLRNLPSEFQNYLTPAGNTTLEQLIINTLLVEDSLRIVELIDVRIDIANFKNNLVAEKESLTILFRDSELLNHFANKYSPEDDSFKTDSTLISNVINGNYEGIDNQNEKRDRLIKVIDSLEISADKKILIKQTIEEYDSTKQTLDDLKRRDQELFAKLHSETIEKIEKVELFSVAALQSGFQVKDIEFYAGFDLGENYLVEGHSVSTFFTINIYARKTNLNEPFQSKAFWDFITSRFSLSTGLGIYTPNVEKSGPLYFIGAGFRINKVFRANLGYAFFKTEENKFTGHTSLGLSVGFRQVTDILQIFNGTTSNFQN